MGLMFRGSPGARKWRFIARSCVGRLAEPWRVDVVSGGRPWVDSTKRCCQGLFGADARIGYYQCVSNNSELVFFGLCRTSFEGEGGNRVNSPVSTFSTPPHFIFLHLCINLIIPLFTLFTLF